MVEKTQVVDVPAVASIDEQIKLAEFRRSSLNSS